MRIALINVLSRPQLAPDDPFGYLRELGYWQGETAGAAGIAGSA